VQAEGACNFNGSVTGKVSALKANWTGASLGNVAQAARAPRDWWARTRGTVQDQSTIERCREPAWALRQPITYKP